MALLNPNRSSISFVRLAMASSFFISNCLHCHSAPLTRSPSLFIKPRVNIQLRKVPSRDWYNAVPRRAFIASSISTEAFQESSASKTYGSEQIQVLQGLDPVRKRSGMYIGSTGPRGLHHLVYEILDMLLMRLKQDLPIRSKLFYLLTDLSVLPTMAEGFLLIFIHSQKKSALETVLTVLHTGGKFGGESSGYNVSGGLHGVGLSVVNALSESLEVTVWRDGMEYQQRYSRGKPVTKLTCRSLSNNDNRGTKIRFWPDKENFTSEIKFDHNTIAGRIRELAFLNPELCITLRKEDIIKKISYLLSMLGDWSSMLNGLTLARHRCTMLWDFVKYQME